MVSEEDDVAPEGEAADIRAQLWPKRLAVLRDRGLDFAEVTEAFLTRAARVAVRGDRHLVVGMLGGRPVAVVYVRLGSEAVSIVTMRPASRKERRLL